MIFLHAAVLATASLSPLTDTEHPEVPVTILFERELGLATTPHAFLPPTEVPCKCDVTLDPKPGSDDHSCTSPAKLCYQVDNTEWLGVHTSDGDCPTLTGEEEVECLEADFDCKAKYKFDVLLNHNIENEACCCGSTTNSVWSSDGTHNEVTDFDGDGGSETISEFLQVDCVSTGPGTDTATWYLTCTSTTPNATNQQITLVWKINCAKCDGSGS